MAQDLFKETVEIYYHVPDPDTLDPIKVRVVGCVDDETPVGDFIFFDLFDDDTGKCLNEGNPFEQQPTRRQVAEYMVIKYVAKHRHMQKILGMKNA